MEFIKTKYLYGQKIFFYLEHRIMETYIRYVSLGTATLLLLSGYCKADIREDLDSVKADFAALNDTSDNWKAVAQDFIRVFDSFNDQLIAVAEENGGKAAQGSFIDVFLWKMNLIVKDCQVGNFLKPEIKDPIEHKYWMYYKRDEKFKKCFKKVEKPLKKKIIACLRVKKLKDAGIYWEENFVNSVEQLVINYSKEMNNDAEALQCLLDLYRCYCHCETIIYKEPHFNNFKKASNKFFDALVGTILACDKKDEKRNTLFTILTSDDVLTIDGKDYFGTRRYAIGIVDLFDKIQLKMAAEMIQPNEVLAKAIDMLGERADSIKKQQQQRAEGASWRLGTGL